MAFVPRDRISVLCTDAYHIIFNAVLPKFLYWFCGSFIAILFILSSMLNNEVNVRNWRPSSISIYICINHCIHALLCGILESKQFKIGYYWFIKFVIWHIYENMCNSWFICNHNFMCISLNRYFFKNKNSSLFLKLLSMFFESLQYSDINHSTF